MSLLKPTPKAFKHFHFCMTVVWAILMIPSLLWWKTSILWVIIVSVYANWIGHFSAFNAADAATKNSQQTKG